MSFPRSYRELVNLEYNRDKITSAPFVKDEVEDGLGADLELDLLKSRGFASTGKGRDHEVGGGAAGVTEDGLLLGGPSGWGRDFS